MKKITYSLVASLLTSTSMIQATPAALNDWTETFNCKGGLTITHTPQNISWKTPKQAEITSTKETFELWMNPATYAPLKKPLVLKVQSSKNDFKAALIADDLMEPDPVPVVAPVAATATPTAAAATSTATPSAPAATPSTTTP